MRLITDVTPYVDRLVELVQNVVADGASIGFLAPLSTEDARAYWHAVCADDVRLWIVEEEGDVIATIQLHLATKQNGLHRAEIAKLMVGPQARRRGIARQLMQLAEEEARQLGRTLIVLDTRQGDPSNLLYQSLGYNVAGEIPNFAQSNDGSLHATVLYYKNLA